MSTQNWQYKRCSGKVIKKRLKGIQEGRFTNEWEVFDLDILDYLSASYRMMQKFLITEEFEEN